MIVLGSNISRKIGKIENFGTDKYGNPFRQPFKIMESSNHFEWLEYFLNSGGNPNLIDGSDTYEYYYKVHTD